MWWGVNILSKFQLSEEKGHLVNYFNNHCGVSQNKLELDGVGPVDNIAPPTIQPIKKKNGTCDM